MHFQLNEKNYTSEDDRRVAELGDEPGICRPDSDRQEVVVTSPIRACRPQMRVRLQSEQNLYRGALRTIIDCCMQPQAEDLSQRYCQVCFVSFDRASPRSLQEGLEVLLCSQCKVAVHRCCYDFHPSGTILDKHVSEFLCQACRGASSKAPTCVVCYGQEGAFKPLQNSDEFVHVFCGLIHNQIDVVSYFPSISFRKSAQYQQLSNICEICMKRNAHDQCAQQSCRKKVHTYCAKRIYTVLSQENDDPRSWNHHISVGNHGPGGFDISDQVLPLEMIQEEVDSCLKPLADLPLSLPQVPSLTKKIHKEYTDELRGKRKSTKKLRRGGFSYVLCPMHQSTPYCVCQTRDEGEMVLCQCCFEWFHQTCINFIPEGADEKWVCHYCKVFYESKKKIVEEVQGGRSDWQVNKLELPLKISVADLMWVMRAVDNRIRGGQGVKMMKELLKYPLKSSCMQLLIKQQSRPKLTALAQEVIGLVLANPSELLSGLKPKRVLELDVSGRPIVLDQNVAYNVRLGKVLQKLLIWGVPAQHMRTLQLELQFKAKAVSDQYEQIYELSKTEQPYQEVPILKQKATAYHYQHILTQIQNNIPLSFSSLLNTQQQLQNNQHIPPYMLEILNAKVALVQPLITQLTQTIHQQPENMSKILLLLKQLQNLYIEAPQIYLQLKAQKTFINELHLYYTKIHGPSGQDLSVNSQIEQLISWQSIKPSQELVDIMNSYSPKDHSIWQNTPNLVRYFKKVTLQFEIKEILKRKVVKQEKLMKLVEDIETDSGKFSEEVMGFLEQWKPIKSKIDQIIQLNLQKVQDFTDISDNLKNVNQCCEGLQSLGIKIEDEGKVSLLSQLKTKKEELQQLQILFTEAQLQKNPLTLSKLVPSLPKNNTLVKNYISLKKQYSTLMNRYSTYLACINERLQLFKGDSKKQRKDQIKENNEKPTLNQIREFMELLKASQIDMGRQIKELNRIMSNTLQIASKVRRYCEEKSNLEEVKTIQELKNRRKDVDQLRKKVLTLAELNLKTELVELYHIQIMIRMKNAILTPNLELDKIGVLIKFAEEENLIHDNMYKTLKERFETKNQRSKEVNQIKTIEQMLQSEASRDNSGNYLSLSNYRRGLVLSDPIAMKISSSYVEDLIEKNKSIRARLNNILNGKVKMEYQEVRPLYLQALKNPFSIPQLSKITPEINKTWDILKRWKELNKQYTLAHPIFSDYQLCLFAVEEIDVIRKQLKNNQEELSTLKFLVESFSEETRDQMEGIVDRMENNPVVKDTEVCLSGEKLYLEYWMKLLVLSQKSRSLISYEKLRRLALDSYNLLQKNIKRGDEYKDLIPIVTQIEKHLANVKNHFKLYPKYSPEHTLVDNFIDLEDYYLDNEDEPDLAELVPLFKPFEDITKFRFKNLQTIEFKREDSLKRSYSRFDEIRGESDKNIILPGPSSSSSSSQEQLPQVVSDNERRKIKQIFLKNIRKNPELQKYPQYENEVKMIENQIFGEWHNDILKYFQTSDSFQKLFIKLITCPNISNKIIKKKFEFKFIQLLVNHLHKIDELESMVVAKNKQEETQKSIKDVVTVGQPEVKHQPIIESIATGNVDQAAREDLKKEMKMLKEVKEGKEGRQGKDSKEGKQHKKKKKKDNKHRDRSKSPEAKFSSDSQKELPKYIEAEYNKDETKQPVKSDPFGHKASDSPLRYDPEEEELLKREVIHPKGSILKLKSCQADIQTRKRGRMEFAIDLFTEEQHKKLLELVDPGFTKLPIRKEKSEAQMLPYIGKSRKKYRFIVGWFEAVNPDQNDLLKELAEEAVQKKKVYGWQNEHIKVHMMAVKQLVTIPKFTAPGRVTSQQAANALNENRMVFVIQYPDRLYELRDNYQPFDKISCITEEYPVNVPHPAIETRPINDYYNNYRVPTIQSFKPAFKEADVVYQSWGDIPAVPQPVALVQPQPQQQYGLPQRVNQVRIQFNFGNFSPIASESEDNQEDKEKEEDLAANLINAYEPVPAAETQSRESNQPYQGYYGGYQQQQFTRQQPQQRPPQNRWMNYQMAQGQQPPQNVYNPLNPMAGRYSGPAGQGQGMYNNQMMGQRNPQMQGQYYDPRYSGYKHPQ